MKTFDQVARLFKHIFKYIMYLNSQASFLLLSIAEFNVIIFFLILASLINIFVTIKLFKPF